MPGPACVKLHRPVSTWTLEPQPPPARDTVVARVAHGGGTVTRLRFLTELATEPGLRAALTAQLRAAPYPAFAWETPALGKDTLALPAEVAIVDSPALARASADPAPFAEQLAAASDDIATFPNLGKDAILVVPQPRAAPRSTHLAEFVRTAPDAVVDALWKSVGLAVKRRLGSKPLWVSTAGLGVSWLHVRLDDRPKYYRHHAYTNPAA